jgi:hypothetical protein
MGNVTHTCASSGWKELFDTPSACTSRITLPLLERTTIKWPNHFSLLSRTRLSGAHVLGTAYIYAMALFRGESYLKHENLFYEENVLWFVWKIPRDATHLQLSSDDTLKVKKP